ncbi:MAG: adenylate kinase [Candidatus Binatia bacterium]
MRLVLLGPPGSGKGTQSVRLKEKLGISHVSSGELLRDAVKRRTALGKKAQEFMNSGRLVSDDLVLDMMRERLAEDDCEGGFLLDGFPRTLAQARALSGMLAENGWPLDRVVLLDVNEAEILQRIRGRREAEHRSDDDEVTARGRLDVYEKETKPLLGFYRDAGLLLEIDGIGAPEEIFERILVGVAGPVENGSKGYEVDG